VARIIGIGLVALDVVIDEQSNERLGASAGGSCGNVLTILSWLDWDAAPVARLDRERNGRLIRKDLKRWAVDQRWLGVGELMPTPIFIERLRQEPDGTISHRFDRYCPACGGQLPRYQPVPRKALGPVIDDLDAWEVLYIDRPSAGAVRLAYEARSRGKLVVYEPSARGNAQHMADISGLAQVIKYSSDRLRDGDRAAIAEASPDLEIETLGDRGLRYRTGGQWQTLRPPSVTAKDTAGAGDWTTAGLLEGLRPHRFALDLSTEALRDVLSFAQALGAWSCRFRGPRGAMVDHTGKDAIRAARALIRGGDHTVRRPQAASAVTEATWICSGCP
jgi:fructokinase